MVISKSIIVNQHRNATNLHFFQIQSSKQSKKLFLFFRPGKQKQNYLSDTCGFFFWSNMADLYSFSGGMEVYLVDGVRPRFAISNDL